MKIILTGSAGFIGFHFSRNLLEAGHEITFVGFGFKLRVGLDEGVGQFVDWYKAYYAV